MEQSSFFNSINGDRRYKAENFASYFASFIGNGVFPNPSSNLQVVPNNDMTVTVKPGKAWINGYYYINDSELKLKIDEADAVLDRMDRIVVRLDYNAREIKIKIKKGKFESDSKADKLQRDSDIYEIALADIKISKGVIGINSLDISDLRLNTELCGIVECVVKHVDTTDIFNQYQNYLNEKIKSNEFSEWLQSLKNKLDPNSDVALQLQLQLDGVISNIKNIDLSAEKVKLESDNFKATNVKDAFDELYKELGSGELKTSQKDIKGAINEVFISANNSLKELKNSQEQLEHDKEKLKQAIVGKCGENIGDNLIEMINKINKLRVIPNEFPLHHVAFSGVVNNDLNISTIYDYYSNGLDIYYTCHGEIVKYNILLDTKTSFEVSINYSFKILHFDNNKLYLRDGYNFYLYDINLKTLTKVFGFGGVKNDSIRICMGNNCVFGLAYYNSNVSLYLYSLKTNTLNLCKAYNEDDFFKSPYCIGESIYNKNLNQLYICYIIDEREHKGYYNYYAKGIYIDLNSYEVKKDNRNLFTDSGSRFDRDFFSININNDIYVCCENYIINCKTYTKYKYQGSELFKSTFFHPFETDLKNTIFIKTVASNDKNGLKAIYLLD